MTRLTTSRTTAVRRTARTLRRCSCGRPIAPGDVYIEHTQFPGHDAGYATAAGHPVRSAECAKCATRYGRAALLAPTTAQPQETAA